ncbi:DNA polymerase III subunit alpha [Caminibacter sp.]
MENGKLKMENDIIFKKRIEMSVKEHYIEFRNALSKNDTKKAEEEFEKAFNEAFAIYQQKLAQNQQFDLSNEEELFTLVTLFDNMVGYYNEGMYDDGIALAESLVDLTPSAKLKEMFKGFSLGMQSGVPLGEFMQKYVDLSKVDPEFPQFLCNFKEEIKELIS